jgi:hypothetical protein
MTWGPAPTHFPYFLTYLSQIIYTKYLRHFAEKSAFQQNLCSEKHTSLKFVKYFLPLLRIFFTDSVQTRHKVLAHVALRIRKFRENRRNVWLNFSYGRE